MRTVTAQSLVLALLIGFAWLFILAFVWTLVHPKAIGVAILAGGSLWWALR